MDRSHASFARQRMMTTLGATLESVAPGEVVIAFPFDEAWTQQHGFLHAGVVTAVVDSACGYAALTGMPEDAGVVAVELKINFAAPALGERFLATGRVERAWRTLIVCRGEVQALDGETRRTIALLQSTVMVVRDREGVRD